jgi:non-ribosomal peptide synthetase component F
MPEGPEVETESLQEKIHEGAQREGNGLLKAIALSTALFAALAALASMQASDSVNRALVLKSEANRLQTEAADQWAYYQAKGIKGAVQEASRTAWLAAGKEPPATFEATAKRYKEEQQEIEKAARAKETERDARDQEAAHLFHRHHGFASSVAFIQVAIALGAIAALTRLRWIWYGSLLLGLAGAGLLVNTLMR